MRRTVLARRSISVEVRDYQDRGKDAGSNWKDATATQSGLLAETDTATQSGLLSPGRFDSGLAIAKREWQRRLAAFVGSTMCVKGTKARGQVFSQEASSLVVGRVGSVDSRWSCVGTRWSMSAAAAAGQQASREEGEAHVSSHSFFRRSRIGVVQGSRSDIAGTVRGSSYPTMPL